MKYYAHIKYYNINANYKANKICMSKKMIPCIYIGTSGWNYEHWKNIFYPATFAKSPWLQFYAQKF